MKKIKSGFTMIELVFVIVILGILAGVAIPRLAVSRDDATVAKIRADLAAIRSGISLQKAERLMEGNVTAPDVGEFFVNVLDKPLSKGNDRNGWKKDGDNYKACVAGKCATFTYHQIANGNIKAGSLTCEGENCHLFE